MPLKTREKCCSQVRYSFLSGHCPTRNGLSRWLIETITVSFLPGLICHEAPQTDTCQRTGNFNAIRSGSNPVSREYLPPATYGMDRLSGSRPESAKGQPRCSLFTSTWRQERGVEMKNERVG